LPYPEKIGYVEYIDMVKLGSLLSNDPRHVYLVAQPGSFISIDASFVPEFWSGVINLYRFT
jgi:uncharacterized membrane protein